MVEFLFTYKNYDESEAVLRYPVEIPFSGNRNELVHRIVDERMDPIMKYLDNSGKYLQAYNFQLGAVFNWGQIYHFRVAEDAVSIYRGRESKLLR